MEEFLAKLLSGVYVQVYLTSGVKLEGGITDHDSEGFILTRNDKDMLVYYQSVATISELEIGND